MPAQANPRQNPEQNTRKYMFYSWVFSILCYGGMEVASLIAATIQMSKGFDRLAEDWLGRQESWGNLTSLITDSFCCLIHYHNRADIDELCSNQYLSVDTSNFSFANEVFFATSTDSHDFISPTPTANYAGLTTAIPIFFGAILISSIFSNSYEFRDEVLEARDARACLNVCCHPFLAFIVLLPYLFVIFNLGDFNKYSGALIAVQKFCDTSYNISETVPNVYNSSALFLTQYYEGNDSYLLFLPVILLEAAAIVVSYYAAFLINRARSLAVLPVVATEAELQTLLPGQPSLEQPPLDPSSERMTAAAPPPRELTYKEKIDFIEKHDPDFLSSQQALYPMLFCPITLNIMVEPVIASDGHFYERSALLQILQGKRRVSPMTQATLTNDFFIAAPIRSAIRDCVDRKYHALRANQPEGAGHDEYARLSGISIS